MNPLIELKITPLFLVTFMLAYGGVLPRSQAQTELGSCAVTVDGNRLSVIGNETANTIEIVGVEERSVRVTCDGATDTFTDIEEVTVEGRDGDDNVTVDDSNGFLGGLPINIFSQGRADMVLLVVLPLLPLFETLGITFVGAPGPDVLQIAAGPLADRLDITPGSDPNSFEMVVTDIATGAELANVTGAEVEAITIEAGDGDDQISTDNTTGLLGGIAIGIFGQDGNDEMRWLAQLGVNIVDFVDADGGAGEDVLRIVSGQLAEQFDVRRGEAEDAVEVQVTDIETGMVTGNVMASAVERTSVKSGAGNDILNVTGGLPTDLSFFGEEGDNEMVLAEVLAEILPSGVSLLTFLGGTGLDKFTYEGATASEQYEIAGVVDEIADPELRVTDMATGLQLARVQFLHVEDVKLDASGGDDVVDVNWDAALMSGLSLIRADLGKGNNTMSINILPVLTMPETEGVQTARFDVVGAGGTDQVTFNHSAGGWFDVFFTLDTGKGDDACSVDLIPPPDNGLPPPEGVRSLQFDIAAGSGNDSVATHNRTTDAQFFANLSADFGGGNDTFEGIGQIHDANLLPGRGFDTARVTRNFLPFPFISEFERVKILD